MPRSTLLAPLSVIALATVTAHADPPVCTQPDANTRVCHIDRPDVRQRLATIPQITFAADDVVEVAAGGCVQLASGTWRQYVSPRGESADERHFGTIQIGGVTAGVVRVASLIGRKFRVPAGVPATDLVLRLGYDDDGYADNGYGPNNGGTCSQCVGEPDAWVHVVIRKNAGFSNPVPRDMDLFWVGTDPNFLPLNPHWWKRLMTGAAPDVTTLCDDFRYQNAADLSCQRFAPACTSQAPDVDSPFADPLCNAGRENAVSGHVNYLPATYEGTLEWSDHSFDDDYNWRLFPVGGAGLTMGKTNLGIETDSEETIDRMGSPWWQRYHQLVDSGDPRPLVDGKFAIVTGLMGFDCGHNPCSPELHPAYAMAIHVDDNPYDDQWAYFLSNFGDEGWCSAEDHPLDLSRFTFRLPRATAGTTGTIALDAVSINGVSSQGVRFVSGVGAEVSFALPAPSAHGLSDGLIHLGWAPHPDYQTGARIPANVTPCAQKIGAVDPFCVNNGWDAICVREARDLCSTHSLCSIGAAVAKLDSACATKVCNADGFCCQNSWDNICRSEALSMCSFTCAAGSP